MEGIRAGKGSRIALAWFLAADGMTISAGIVCLGVGKTGEESLLVRG